MSRPRRTLLLALSIALAAAASARADGAFPDAQQILLPTTRPTQVLLATNFGLLTSNDGGTGWTWVCEAAIAPFPSLFQLTAPPQEAVLAVAPSALVRSTDGCLFSPATGALAGHSVLDAFADPADPTRVLAIAADQRDGGSGAYALYASADGGQSFSTVLFVAPAGVELTGIEIARSAPQTLYLTAVEYGSAVAGIYLYRSSDGGGSFVKEDLTGSADGALSVRLAAVDPSDATRVYLRLEGESTDTLGVADGAAQTLALPLALTARMSALLPRADGSLLVATREADVYESKDQGQSFSHWAHAPHVRALAERGGLLYAAGDPLADGYALATSADDGQSFQPLLTTFDTCGPPVTCAAVANACAGAWQTVADAVGGLPASCGDGGGPITTNTVFPITPTTGCHCQLGGAGPPPPPWPLLPLLVLLLRRRGRRR